MIKAITGLTGDELNRELAAMGEPAYRAGQVFRRIYKERAEDFASMANLPAALRRKLTDNFTIGAPSLIEERLSADGAEKYLLKTDGGDRIETVFIPSRNSRAVCVSTQVGCKFACAFCVSGRNGFKRDLTADEIVVQVLFVKKRHADLSNAVFMGTGEPLDNLDNVVKGVRIIGDKDGLGISERRITISTCGIPGAVDRLAKTGLRANLAISLHAADDETRRRIMPVAGKYPLRDVVKALARYATTARSRITIEYALMKGVNDFAGAAERLAAIAKKLRAKVNLIAVNPPGERGTGAGGRGAAGKAAARPPARAGRFAAPAEREIVCFAGELRNRGVAVTVRRPRGADIEAACGQLKAEIEAE